MYPKRKSQCNTLYNLIYKLFPERLHMLLTNHCVNRRERKKAAKKETHTKRTDKHVYVSCRFVFVLDFYVQ